MKVETEIIPEDLRNFLVTNSGRQIVFDRTKQPNLEVVSLQFYASNELKLRTFTLDTYDYYLNHNEPGNDPELRYDIEGLDLVRACNSYEPEGILVYFPTLQEYGCWDCDHLIITIFLDASWCEIEQRLAKYVNAQWYPDQEEQYLLRPWDDERFENVKARPSQLQA
jgi:hypothetical protein